MRFCPASGTGLAATSPLLPHQVCFCLHHLHTPGLTCSPLPQPPPPPPTPPSHCSSLVSLRGPEWHSSGSYLIPLNCRRLLLSFEPSFDHLLELFQTAEYFQQALSDVAAWMKVRVEAVPVIIASASHCPRSQAESWYSILSVRSIR